MSCVEIIKVIHPDAWAYRTVGRGGSSRAPFSTHDDALLQGGGRTTHSLSATGHCHSFIITLFLPLPTPPPPPSATERGSLNKHMNDGRAQRQRQRQRHKQARAHHMKAHEGSPRYTRGDEMSLYGCCTYTSLAFFEVVAAAAMPRLSSDAASASCGRYECCTGSSSVPCWNGGGWRGGPHVMITRTAAADTRPAQHGSIRTVPSITLP
jgi:hypothetical protein